MPPGRLSCCPRRSCAWRRSATPLAPQTSSCTATPSRSSCRRSSTVLTGRPWRSSSDEPGDAVGSAPGGGAVIGTAADPGWHGGVTSERAECVLCPNPSPMTLDGTNTWLLAEPGSDEVVVVDPGPLDEGHLQNVLRHVTDSGRRVALTLLTHGHADHAESADRFHELTGAPVRGFGRGHDDLRAGETITVGGLEVVAVETPGHTSDSFSFVLPADNTLLTGDTILGRGTTVVAWPDGSLEAYLASLDRIEALTRAGDVTSLLPGHGPFV